MNNRFGTTSDMIIQTVQERKGCACLAIDEKGLYLTSPAYVNRLLANPNRYAGNHKDVAIRLNALSLDADSLLEQSRHRIPKITGESKKKVNPLRASKRNMKGWYAGFIDPRNKGGRETFRFSYQRLNKEEQQIIEEVYHLRLPSLERRRKYMGMPVEARA